MDGRVYCLTLSPVLWPLYGAAKKARSLLVLHALRRQRRALSYPVCYFGDICTLIALIWKNTALIKKDLRKTLFEPKPIEAYGLMMFAVNKCKW